MAELDYQTPSDELIVRQVSSVRAWHQRAQAIIVLLLVAAAVHGTTYQITEATMEDTESLAQVNVAQANFQSISKEGDHCATLREMCKG